MSGGDRRATPDGLADLPIQRPSGSTAAREPSNLSLFEESEAVDSKPVVSPDAAGDQNRDDRSPKELAVQTGLDGVSPPEQPADAVAPEDWPEEKRPDPHRSESEAQDAFEWEESRPSFSAHLLAGLGDGLIHGTVLAIGVVSMAVFELTPHLNQWPGFLAFLVLFSLLYFTLPLALWGQSPGMAWQGLKARDREARPLTFGQAAQRFAAAWLTAVFLGLPLLIALSGRTLADRMSGSTTSRSDDRRPLEEADGGPLEDDESD